MFTKEEIFILKELVEIEINEDLKLIEKVDEADANELKDHIEKLKTIIKKLSN